MKVLVTGGREYDDWKTVSSVLSDLHKEFGISVIIHGAATGADTLADDWARSKNIPVRKFKAAWKNITVKGAVVKTNKYGKYNSRAGIFRNIEMFKSTSPNIVVAFPGANGTTHMREYAKKQKTWTYNVSDEEFHPITVFNSENAVIGGYFDN